MRERGNGLGYLLLVSIMSVLRADGGNFFVGTSSIKGTERKLGSFLLFPQPVVSREFRNLSRRDGLEIFHQEFLLQESNAKVNTLVSKPNFVP